MLSAHRSGGPTTWQAQKPPIIDSRVICAPMLGSNRVPDPFMMTTGR